MKKLFSNLSVYESILLAYYSEEGAPLKSIYNDEWHDVVKRFIDVYTAEDATKQTDLVGVARKLYSNPKFKNRAELCKSLGMSYSTLKRLRVRFCQTLEALVRMTKNSVDS